MTVHPLDESCETCWFWMQTGNDPDSGRCRRYPPAYDGNGPSSFNYPIKYLKRPDSWCGEYSEHDTYVRRKLSE